ncbi:amidohydrolase family protein [Pedobacter sp. AW31-3R]|uniref:amidohydrolase family protein n=1 Tax=Pedobacter sp. AW31-3R TaxID=3445781 RepID=UPI003FA147E7
MKIDAHQHFWNYDPLKHEWIGDDMAVIRRDFLPDQLSAVLQENHIEGCVAVQADQTVEETTFLLELSDTNEFIKGVVGWVDLQSPDVADYLQQFSSHPKFKGLRHVLQGEAKRDLMLSPPFLEGISKLATYDLSYDILIFADQLQFVPEFVAMFPDTRFVIDHIAKPEIKNGNISQWKKDLEGVAQHRNVSCKISGMVTEADLKNWKPADFKPYLDVVVDAFGIDRVMYGSDWPVCLAAGSYAQVFNLVSSYFRDFSTAEQELFFGGNATHFYKLD